MIVKIYIHIYKIINYIKILLSCHTLKNVKTSPCLARLKACLCCQVMSYIIYSHGFDEHFIYVYFNHFDFMNIILYV